MAYLLTCYCLDCDNPEASHCEDDKEDHNSMMRDGGIMHLWNCAHVQSIIKNRAWATTVKCDCSTKAV